VPSVLTPTPTKTGLRSQIWPSAEESRTASPSATTVSPNVAVRLPYPNTQTTRPNQAQSPGQKLKRRMEDLERRAFSPSRSTSPESTPAAALPSSAPKQKQKQKQTPPQRPVHIKAKSHNSVPTQSSWGNAHSPTPSLRNSTSSFDEEATLARFGYGLPSPALDRTALTSTASSYPMHEPQHLASMEYTQEPWYESMPGTSASTGYGNTYSAWNSVGATAMYGAGGGTARGHGQAQSAAMHVKQEQMDDDDMHGFGLNSYQTIPSSTINRRQNNSAAAPSYALSATQSYVSKSGETSIPFLPSHHNTTPSHRTFCNH